ncbi:MAG: ATP-binding protein [Rhodospirillum sp.]|nr:ATP-binding protein [Rhodospirillum sp.]MCF8491391.1 ATP-binding protein [Rhodospirillum sp.]MCF8503157.1 ATP-binding protein [Rhodospirillum sp.]
MPLDQTVNTRGATHGTTAPLRNVMLFTEAMHKVINRPKHLPGMVTFHGPSGYGKTFSAAFAANKFKAYYLEVGESWTKAKFCKALLIELGINKPKGTVADMIERIIDLLSTSTKPLIIDEFDHVVKRGYVETIREIHDKSRAPIALIGEENLPQMLMAISERFHNRMLDWFAAQPADAEDTVVLAELHAPEITIAPDLAAHLAEVSHGRVRRICVNIEKVRDEAVTNGWVTVDRATWGERPLFTGAPPSRRI